MQDSLFAILSLGFGLGLLHALDADHIMAVTTLSSRQAQGKNGNRWRTLRFCSQWALGHGGVLLLLGTVVLVAGISLPPQLSMVAEKLVGVILIALGLWIFWQFYRNKLQLRVHSHDDVTHVHLAEPASNRHDHSPVLVGITHGLAGSAPVLALVPVANNGHGWFGLLYICLFSLGVLLSMFVFGLGFNTMQERLEHYSTRLFNLSRLLMATLSISFGSYWLFAA